jgi:hypothetical protein
VLSSLRTLIEFWSIELRVISLYLSLLVRADLHSLTQNFACVADSEKLKAPKHLFQVRLDAPFLVFCLGFRVNFHGNDVKHSPLVLKDHYYYSNLLLEKLNDFVEISASFYLR